MHSFKDSSVVGVSRVLYIHLRWPTNRWQRYVELQNYLSDKYPYCEPVRGIDLLVENLSDRYASFLSKRSGYAENEISHAAIEARYSDKKRPSLDASVKEHRASAARQQAEIDTRGKREQIARNATARQGNLWPSPGTLDAVKNDDLFTQVKDAIDRYSSVLTVEWLGGEDEPASYPYPKVSDEQIAKQATEALLGTFDKLCERHEPHSVLRAISAELFRLHPSGMKDGYDNDGFSFYEPHGRGYTKLLQALKDRCQERQLENYSTQELVATKETISRFTGFEENYEIDKRHKTMELVTKVLDQRSPSEKQAAKESLGIDLSL